MHELSLASARRRIPSAAARDARDVGGRASGAADAGMGGIRFFRGRGGGRYPPPFIYNEKVRGNASSSSRVSISSIFCYIEKFRRKGGRGEGRKEKGRQTNTHTDGRTDRQTQTSGWVDGRAGSRAGGRADRRTGGHAGERSVRDGEGTTFRRFTLMPFVARFDI